MYPNFYYHRIKGGGVHLLHLMAGYDAHTGNRIPRFVENVLSLIIVRTVDANTRGSMLSVSRTAAQVN